jgi:hypothetical protein
MHEEGMLKFGDIMGTLSVAIFSVLGVLMAPMVLGGDTAINGLLLAF